MVSTFPASDEPDYSLLLMAHLVCADEQIHIQEARSLQSLLERTNAGKATKDALEAILSKASEAPSIHSLVDEIPPGKQTETLKQLFAMACVDGYLAPMEESFIQNVAGIWDISEEEVNRLRLSAQGYFILKRDLSKSRPCPALRCA